MSSKKSTKRSIQNSNFQMILVLICVLLFVLVFPFQDPVNAAEAQSKEIVSPEVAAEETQSQVPATEPPAPIALEIHQIDVGCANAYLIRYDGKCIFVDGGQSFSYKTVSNYLDNLGVESIDTYIATHWHGDHADNMSTILEKYAYKATIVFGPSKSPNGKYTVSQGRYVQLEPGKSINIGDVVLTCVGPYEVKNDGNSNPDSLNFIIQYGDFKALMTGDYVYENVIEEYSELTKDVDVLQMPHHGLDPLCISKTALLHCNPSLVLVPANSSSPTNKVVRELNLDATVLNNQSGCIAVVTYGDDYTVYTGVIASDFEY